MPVQKAVSQQLVTDDTLLEVEALYDEFDAEEQKKSIPPKRRKNENKQQALKKADQVKQQRESKISDLTSLAAFSDISVIQKRFLPKTYRFEINGSLANSINNQFFNNFGLETRLGFYISETWGLELSYVFLGDSRRGVTDNLVDKQRIDTRSLVVPDSFYGGYLKWSPIYGKIALFNDDIVPFDTHFLLGFGTTTTGLGEDESTLSLGVGQTYAHSKDLAFRWDMTLNSYKARVIENLAAGGTEEDELSQFDFFLSAGVSFYFPGAKYR